MSRVVVRIGSEGKDQNGNQYDHMRPVAFIGKNIAQVSNYVDDTGCSGQYPIETLYQLENGQLVVYYKTKITTSSLVLVSPADLDTGGRFETLGSNAGMVKVLTLTEALDANLDHG